MRLYLNRISYSGEGTFGVLKLHGIPFAVTLELPWKNNVPFISCIPEDVYTCHRYSSARWPSTFQICSVSNRTYILFHRANTIADLKGCVGIAEEFGVLRSKPAILSSGRGFDEFMDIMKSINKFSLVINSVSDVKPILK